MKWLVPINNTNGSHFCYWREVDIGPKTWGSFAYFIYILIGPLLTVVTFFGVIGNFWCILTFSRFLRKLKIYRHLLALALWDMFYVITSFFLYNLPTLMFTVILSFGPYVVTTPFLYYISTVARTGSIWTVLVIAFDRYLAICHPFRFFEVDTERRFTILIAVIGLCSFLYGIPRYFEVELYNCYEVTTNILVPIFTPTAMRSVFTYWLFYRILGGGLFYSLIPFITLLILTIRMSVEIKRLGQFSPIPDRFSCPDSNENVSNSISSTSSDKINHWMHVAMITKFLICHSLPTVLDVWELAEPTINGRTHSFMLHSVMFLATLNSSCNFFIYFITSQKFRKDSFDCFLHSK